MKNFKNIIFTCEHASYAIPPEHKALFKEQREFLKTHRGWDKGAFPIAKIWSRKWKAPLWEGYYSRLLVDLNRSEDHKNVFSKWTRALSTNHRNEILDKYHRPHWQNIRSEITKRLSGKLIHIGVHSFTPVYKGKVRSTHIGILTDPMRPMESRIALQWQKNLRKASSLTVHRNRPYRGTGNGLVSKSRKVFPASKYMGFEIEINHGLLRNHRDIKLMSELLEKTFPHDLA